MGKAATPKYGLLYHASLVGQSAPKLKGKMSRVLAAKLALALRCDSLGEDTEPTWGKQFKEYVETRLHDLEDAAAGKTKKGMKKSDVKTFKAKTVKKHNDDDDAPSSPSKKRSASVTSKASGSPMKKKAKTETASVGSAMTAMKKKKAKAETAESSPMKRKTPSPSRKSPADETASCTSPEKGSEEKKKKEEEKSSEG